MSLRTTNHAHGTIVLNEKELQGKDDSARATAAVEKVERCSFCHSKLLFTHDLNLSYLQVVESSRCPGCGVTMRPRTFTLH